MSDFIYDADTWTAWPLLSEGKRKLGVGVTPKTWARRDVSQTKRNSHVKDSHPEQSSDCLRQVERETN